MNGAAGGTAARGGYWYRERGEETESAVELLNELRRYRESSVRMRGRLRDDMGMGEKDLLALRLLLAAQVEGRAVRQQELARSLQITGASCSALVDRLVRDGYAERTPHPADRRSTAVVPTPHGDREVRATLRTMHARMMAVVEQLTLSEREVVIRFLQGLNQSLEEFGHTPAPQGADPAGASDDRAAAPARGSAAAPEAS